MFADDVVLSTFRKQQKQYQTLMKELEQIPVPLTGDDAAIKKYGEQVEALKKKLGMPEYEQILNAQLDYAFACSNYDAKKFVAKAVEDLNLNTTEFADILKDINAAIDDAEAASGKGLTKDNKKGWSAMTKKIAEIEKKYGFADRKKVRNEAIFDMYKKHIEDVRTAVEEDVDKIKRSENLDISLDLSKLKPKLG